jgi:NADH:ubiquinone oxidoreductase subunit 4 (subunit M)
VIAIPHLLTWLIFLPAAGAALLLLFPARAATEAKTAGVVVSLAVFVLSLGLWGYDPAIRAFQ